MRRAVFLDRDGVINSSIVRNGKPYPPETIEEFRYLPGVEASVNKLRAAGFLIIVVTNQPDVAKGIQKKSVIELMHTKMMDDGICDDIHICFHVDEDNCCCRKPKPGMLINAAQKWGICLNQSYLVGDRWRDIEAGKSVNCFTYFVDYHYQELSPRNPDAVVASLEVATKDILAREKVRKSNNYGKS